MSKILSFKNFYLNRKKSFDLIHEYEKSFVRNKDFSETFNSNKKKYSITSLDNSLEYSNIREIEINEVNKRKINTSYIKKKGGLLISYFSCNYNNLLFSLNRAFVCIKRKNIFLKKLIFLKPIRAGFRCMYGGLIGYVLFKSVFLLALTLENILSHMNNINRLVYLKFLSNQIRFFFIMIRHEIKIKFFPSFYIKKSKFNPRKKNFYRKQKLQLLFSIKE